MQGAAARNTATSHEKVDDNTLPVEDRTIYIKSLPRLKHYRELNDEVIDTYLSKICKQHTRIKSKCIPSLYRQQCMDDNLNSISDPKILAR